MKKLNIKIIIKMSLITYICSFLSYHTQSSEEYAEYKPESPDKVFIPIDIIRLILFKHIKKPRVLLPMGLVCKRWFQEIERSARWDYLLIQNDIPYLSRREIYEGKKIPPGETKKVYIYDWYYNLENPWLLHNPPPGYLRYRVKTLDSIGPLFRETSVNYDNYRGSPWAEYGFVFTGHAFPGDKDFREEMLKILITHYFKKDDKNQLKKDVNIYLVKLQKRIYECSYEKCQYFHDFSYRFVSNWKDLFSLECFINEYNITNFIYKSANTDEEKENLKKDIIIRLNEENPQHIKYLIETYSYIFNPEKKELEHAIEEYITILGNYKKLKDMKNSTIYKIKENICRIFSKSYF